MPNVISQSLKFIQRNPSLLLIFGGIALLRLAYCFMLPPYTTDLLRNLGYGKAFWLWGFQLYDLTPYDLSPWPVQFLWPNHHYPYPASTLLFFAGVASVSSAVWWGKLALTGLEAINSWLVYKTSGDRWLALLYWANPISIWFVSREGQFEPYVAFWTLLAIYGLRHDRAWAYGAWGLAVQAKLFPILLAPLFLARMAWRAPGTLSQQVAWGLASGLPSWLAMGWSDYLWRFLQPGYLPAYNPLTWTLTDTSLYPFFPFWLVLAHWIAGVVYLAFGLIAIRKTGRWLEFAAPLALVVLVKANVIGQFWYFILLPAFCLPIQDQGWRRLFFALSALMGIRSLYSIFIGLIGYQNPADAMVIVEMCFWGF